MSPVRLNGSTSGYTELSAPAVANNNSIALPTGNGSAYQILRNGATAGSLEYADNLVLGTLQNSTSGTSIDFTGIPSWVKRVTVMFNGVSNSGTSTFLLQLGAGSIDSTSTYSGAVSFGGSGATDWNTTGFRLVQSATLAGALSYAGVATIVLLGTNIWCVAGTLSPNGTNALSSMSGSKTLSGTLDRVRITTVSGTDTFDAGSINILME